MAENLPTPKSFEQILGEMYATYMSKIGVNDLYTGSAVTSFFETVAQAIYRASGDTFSILRDFSIDRASGESLKRLAREDRVFPLPSSVATGKITITDTNFEKISTKIYAGATPPNIGSTAIYASDGSLFPESGEIYIGRGTRNIEGPLRYTSIVEKTGGVYVFTLDSATPTTRYHNVSEPIILKQGGTRVIPSGTVVQTKSSGASSVAFSTIKSATILDGETTAINVPVTAQEPGTKGNVPRNSITEFMSPPIDKAAVTNPNPFTTGRDEETDEEIRVRVKRARFSKGLGTAIAVENSVLGAQASDENAIVISNDVFSDGETTTLFIDNGSGYEEKTAGIGVEYVIDSALGGEKYFQLTTGGSQTSIAKAFLVSSQSEPFNINPSDRLAILVGGILSEHTFQEGDFQSNGNATSYEIVTSINGNPELEFSARTMDDGSRITISAKAESQEFLQKITPTTGDDAGSRLGFTDIEVETIKLYKNNRPLSRNGRSAVIESEPQNNWADDMESGETITISVDKTDPITYTIKDSDFLAEGTYTRVNFSNSIQSWVNVFNNKITGITASINGDRIVFKSNLGASSRASLVIDLDQSTLVTKGMFSVDQGLSATGSELDFILSRNTAQFKLVNPLEKGDTLTAGTEFTQGTVIGDAVLGGNTSIIGDAFLWAIVDGINPTTINHGIIDNAVYFEKSDVDGFFFTFRSNFINAFANVEVGDYVVFPENVRRDTDPVSTLISDDYKIEGRVYGVSSNLLSNDSFTIRVTEEEWNSAPDTAIISAERMRFVRCDSAPQKIKIPEGFYAVSTISSIINEQIIGAKASVKNNENITITTNNKHTEGGVYIVTFNNSAKNLKFGAGDSESSTFSHFGFFKNGSVATGFPSFVHSYIASDRNIYVPTALDFIPNFDSAIDLGVLNIAPEVMVNVQHPYLTNSMEIKDNQAAYELVQVDDISGTSVDIDDSKFIKRLRTNDRFHLLNPLNFDFDDDIVIIVDNNYVEKTFPVNLYRIATTNTTNGGGVNPDQFRAYDGSKEQIDEAIQNGEEPSEFSKFFGSLFDFKNYKALMRARNVIDPSWDNVKLEQDAILYRSSMWGRSGERTNIAYTYPTSEDKEIESRVTVFDKTRIRISLKSGASVINNIDGTTKWTVTINPNSPLSTMDEVTYSHYVAPNSAIDYITDNTAEPLTEAANDVYILSHNGGVPHADYDGASAGDVVRFNGTTWDATTPTTDMVMLVDDEPSSLRQWSGSAWSQIPLEVENPKDVGTPPNMVDLIEGNYVNINNKGEFHANNQGVFRVVSATPSSFTVHRPTGVAVAETGISTLTTSTIKLYEHSDTTAQEIVTYVNENLINWIEAELIDDNGIEGSGIISKSTYDDSEFLVSDGIDLLDGINWIKSSEIGVEAPTNQFIFKRSLQLPNFDTLTLNAYSFNNGEEIRLIPTTIAQLDEFFSVLAVTGFTTSGIVNTVNRDNNLQLSTQILGSSGSVEVTGGSGNTSLSSVVGSTFDIPDTNLFKLNILTAASGGVNADSWVKISSSVTQKKNIGVNELTKMTITPQAFPHTTSIIKLSERQINDRFFGRPRNNFQCSGRAFQVSKQGSLACIAWDGVTGDDPYFKQVVDFNDQPGVDGNMSVTFDAETKTTSYAITSGDRTFANVQVDDIIKITSTFDNPTNNGTFRVNGISDDGLIISVNNTKGVNESKIVSYGSIEIYTEILEGDTVEIKAPFTSLNQGQFRVIRRYENSIYIDNPLAVEERVLVDNVRDIPSGITIDITISSGLMKVISKDHATAFSSVKAGDYFILGSGFDANNQGKFTVLEVGSFEEDGDIKSYVVVENDGVAEEDIVGGFIKANWFVRDIPIDLTCDVAISNNVMTITSTNYAEGFANAKLGDYLIIGDGFNAANQGTFSIIEYGDDYVKAINRSAVAETGISSGNVEIQIPAMLFSPYNNTRAGDKFFVSGNVLGEANRGSYKIEEVLNRETVIVSGTLETTTLTELRSSYNQIYVDEEFPYIGYKKVYNRTINPYNDQLTVLVIESILESDKINEAAITSLEVQSKLNFDSNIQIGQDAYKYNTGLIAEANKIVYGDPRDSSTYSGVAAAGAEIFIKPPLFKRITMSINVRIQTGIPFGRIAERVRNNVAAVIKSSPISTSIAISDVIASVNAIPGIRAVSISSPAYDENNDIIVVNPSEKALVLDPVNDIVVLRVD